MLLRQLSLLKFPGSGAPAAPRCLVFVAVAVVRSIYREAKHITKSEYKKRDFLSQY